MAVSGRLQVIACERGESLEVLIPRLLDEHNHIAYRVAVELGVYPNTVLHWLKTHKYHLDPVSKRWIRDAAQEVA